MEQWDSQTKLLENAKGRDLQEGEPYMLIEPVQKSEKQ
jgi:hypothetical protein